MKKVTRCSCEKIFSKVVIVNDNVTVFCKFCEKKEKKNLDKIIHGYSDFTLEEMK